MKNKSSQKKPKKGIKLKNIFNLIYGFLIKNLLFVLIFIIIILISVSIYLYIRKFGGDLSNSHERWGQFGDYLNVIINFSIGILVGYISWITYKTTNNFNALHTTPILSFLVKPSDDKRLIDSWYLLNLTEAGAKDVYIKFWVDDKVSKWIKCFSIPGTSEIQLPWLRFAVKIELYYTDTFGKKFYNLKYQDLSGDPVEVDKKVWGEFKNDNKEYPAKWINGADAILQFNSLMDLGKLNPGDINSYKNELAFWV